MLSKLTWLMKDAARILRDIRVVGNNPHALGLCSLQRWSDRIRIVAGDGDYVHFLRDQIINELDLRISRGTGGRFLNHFATDLLLRLFCAQLCYAEVRIGIQLGDEANGSRFRGCIRAKCRGQRKERRVEWYC